MFVLAELDISELWEPVGVVSVSLFVVQRATSTETSAVLATSRLTLPKSNE